MLFETFLGLWKQVFSLTKDGGLQDTRAWAMTNRERKIWLDMMKDRQKQEKEASRSKGKGPGPGGRVPNVRP